MEMVSIKEVCLLIGGEAGYGVMAAGLAFEKACSRGGLHVFEINEYPSLIRGGHNVVRIRVSDVPVRAPISTVDLIIALNQETIDRHTPELTPQGGVIYDSDVCKPEERAGARYYPIPLTEMAKAAGGTIMRNTVALGAAFALLDYDLGPFESVLYDLYSRKGEEIVTENVKAAREGYEHVKQHFNDFPYKLQKTDGSARMVLNGNDAICMGAIKAGCKFYAAYPMTPASSILHTLAAYERKYSLVVKHTEDEIAAINMALGAGYAGVRAMTATSGGGFCLMTEGLGLAGMIEVPLVVVNCQRPGPSTGMPTWSEQGDLKFLLNASQGEFPRIVIAPGDVEECFYETINAFNLAEKYQTPVMILSDKFLAESHTTQDDYSDNITIDRGLRVTDEERITDYRRYLITETGVSPRAVPSQKNCIHTATSDEHDEYGGICEDADVRVQMMQKRMRKLEGVKKDTPPPKLYGDPQAEFTIIGWGSTKGPILEALRRLEDEVSLNFLHVVYLNPLDTEAIEQVLGGARKTICIENNYTAQFAGIIREQTGISIDHCILKYDGRPFYADELESRIKEAI
jgi:2-oxoglutarate ferredoxin oxidoreductase subunit alpha